jgi:hypothetical protein
MTRSVLVLELNELCPPLLERFMAAGDLPNFTRLRAESIAYVTEAEEEQRRLNPWIQWVTVHTGVGFDEHGIHTLGDGDRLTAPTVADAVTAAGGEVWLCGPMNVVPTTPVQGWWLPDPWNPRQRPVPHELEAFGAFVRGNVQEHTNESHRMSAGAVARFVGFMAGHGLRPRSVLAAVRQLLGERTGGAERWKRVALLDRFQWDLFRQHQRRARPTFATYFSNTTAHFQHQYWRHMDPEPFTVKPSEEERRRFGGAIRYGYQEMDRLIGEALELVGDETTLVLCTAISQQPYLAEEEHDGSHFHRPHDMAALVARMGLRDVVQIAPVMAAQFHLFFSNEAAAEAGAAVLRAARVGDREAFFVRVDGTGVFTESAFYDPVPDGAVLRLGSGEEIPFTDLFYRAHVAKSGYHHRDGAFWVRAADRVGAVVPGRVSLRSVAPTLLALMGIDPPPTMRAPVLAVDRAALTSGG